MTKQLPDVVIVGGGFARGLAAARALRNAPAFPTSGGLRSPVEMS